MAPASFRQSRSRTLLARVSWTGPTEGTAGPHTRACKISRGRPQQAGGPQRPQGRHQLGDRREPGPARPWGSPRLPEKRSSSQPGCLYLPSKGGVGAVHSTGANAGAAPTPPAPTAILGVVSNYLLDPDCHAMGTWDTMRAGHHYSENAAHRKVGRALRPRGHLRIPLCMQKRGSHLPRAEH